MKVDPGPCPVCGAAHTACTPDSGPITVTLLPQRDAAAATALGDGADARPFSTATYRGDPKKRRR